MTNIYAQHQAAFARTEAFVILKDDKRVATIAFKFPADGAGRLYAYVHWIGLEMVRGYASGGGYDKRTAACAHAVVRRGGLPLGLGAETGFPDAFRRDFFDFRRALAADRGPTWEHALRVAGFTVLQAV